jgi:hypothetical protein
METFKIGANEATTPKQEQIKPEFTPEEMVEFRFKQSRASRLAEYITGMRPDDPKMPERLILDQKIIRARYKLPERKAAFTTPTEYEHFLKARAEQLGVTIKDKSECGTFFGENPMVGGIHFEEDKVIGLGIKKDSRDEYAKTLGTLEHELIHAEQFQASPRMPIELKEYEAYIAGINAKVVTEGDPQGIEWAIFDFYIGSSVNFWYDDKNQNRKPEEPEATPVWNNPEYFLNNIDKVDHKVIEAYKLKVRLSQGFPY